MAIWIFLLKRVLNNQYKKFSHGVKRSKYVTNYRTIKTNEKRNDDERK